MSRTFLLPFIMPVCIAAATTNVEILGEFNFDNTSSPEVALSPSLKVPGVELSNLGFSTVIELEFAGINGVPSGDLDGYGFSDGIGALHLHRAENGVPSSWGPTVSTDADSATMNFTVTADTDHRVTVVGITFVVVNGVSLIYTFQPAGELRGPELLGSQGGTVELAEPVVIQPGEKMTFTINLNSGDFNSGHVFDAILVEGNVSPAH